MEYGQEDKLFEPDRVAYPNRDRLREDGCLDTWNCPKRGGTAFEKHFLCWWKLMNFGWDFA